MTLIKIDHPLCQERLRQTLARQAVHTPGEVRLTYFVHDDVPAATQALIRAGEMNWIGARLSEAFGLTCHSTLIFDAAGYTDFAYSAANEAAAEARLYDWYDLVDAYIAEQQLPIGLEYKYVLLTAEPLHPNVLGIAGDGGACAIASLGQRKVAGHEVGHLFGASHEDAQILDTPSGPQHTNLTSTTGVTDSYTYSSANQANMRRYLGL